MSQTAKAHTMATDNNHYMGMPGIAAFAVSALALAFGCVEAGKFAMTAFMGA